MNSIMQEMIHQKFHENRDQSSNGKNIKVEDMVNEEVSERISIDNTILMSSKLNKICEDDEPYYHSRVNLRKLCDKEHNFDIMKSFVENNNAETLRNDSDNIFKNIQTINQITEHCKEDLRNIELLLILRMFRKLKKIEKNCFEYRKESDKNNKFQKIYNNDNDYSVAVAIRDYNNNNNSNNNNVGMELLKNIISPYKVRLELLKYELNCYRSKNRVELNKYNYKSIANMMITEINHFNPNIETYIEDHTWTINYKNTLNFAVPSNKFIISNSTIIDNTNNTILIAHMDNLIQYLKKMFKTKSLRYLIVEDNKYYLSWILICVGFTNDNMDA